MSDDTGPATGFETAVDGVLAPPAATQSEAAVHPNADAPAAAGTTAGERPNAGAGGVIYACAYAPDGVRCVITGLRGVLPVLERDGYVVVREVATEAEALHWMMGDGDDE